MTSSEDGWRPGLEVGGHVLLALLGRGGMGAVWRVEHTATGAQRALKVLHGATHPEDLLRFQREVEALGRLDGHPNVVRVHTAGVHQGSPWVVTELLEGGDLAARLKGGPLAFEAAAAIVRDVARGVAHAHARGVLHRDIKPANVLLEASGVPRLADFGLARLHGVESLTQSGALVGTPAYMAPEQARGERADERTDVWGLGAVLYHALSGRPPGVGAGTLGMLADLAEGRVEPLRSLRPDVPPDLDELCRRALALAPHDRWPDAASLAAALERWLSGERVGLSRPRRGFTGALGALGVLSALLALSALLVAWRQRRVEPDQDAAAVVSVVSAHADVVTTRSSPARQPPAPPASPAVVDWPARMAERTERVLLDDLDFSARPRLNAVTRQVAHGERLTEADEAFIEQLARQGVAEAQTAAARLQRGRGRDRRLLLEQLWRATRNPAPDVHAAEDAWILLNEGTPSPDDVELARWLLAEGSARARRRKKVDLATSVALASTKWGTTAGDFGRALRLLQWTPEVALSLRVSLRAAEDDPAVVLLVAIAGHEGWGGDADPKHVARNFLKVLRGLDGPPRTFALLWLERHAPEELRRGLGSRPLPDRGPRGTSLLDEWTQADRHFEAVADP